MDADVCKYFFDKPELLNFTFIFRRKLLNFSHSYLQIVYVNYIFSL